MAKMVVERANPRCFVIAPFGSPFDTYYEKIIRPAIDDAGLQPVRADEINRPGVIVNQIWQEIVDSTACLADVTGRNSNVMYELGIAQALGKPVVPVVQDIDDLPFDLRSVRFIVYDTKAVAWDVEFRQRVTEMLREAVKNPERSVVFPKSPYNGLRNCLGLLIHASSQPMFITDFDRRILSCNQALADLVGAERSEFEGKLFKESLLPWLTKRVASHLREQWRKDQMTLQDTYDRREHPNTWAMAYLDNTDFRSGHRWKGKFCVRIHAVRLPPNDETAGYFVVYDVMSVKRIPKHVLTLTV